MYVNKCIKCGAEFETKNPKRVICPNCLYADKKENASNEGTELKSYSSQGSEEPRQLQSYSSYSPEERPQRRYDNRGGYNRDNRQGGGYNRDNRGGGYNRDNRQGGGYNRDNRGGGYNRDNRQGGGYNRDNRGGGYNRDNRQGGFNRGGGRFQQNKRPRPQQNKQPKALLISKEQLEQIELLYKAMLPLPNTDAHEVIGEKLQIEPRKVFFGINLIRQKMMLPKLKFPKRKLAVSTDQLTAVKSLYEPLLPLPPIGCHKIIAAQLKMEEWRVHVAIKLIRGQMGLDRWNEERTDKPEGYLEKKWPDKKEREALKAAEAQKQQDAGDTVEETAPKAEEVKETEEPVAEEKPKRGRKAKKDDEE